MSLRAELTKLLRKKNATLFEVKMCMFVVLYPLEFSRQVN